MLSRTRKGSALAFVGFFALQLYLTIWGVERLGFSRDYVMGAMVVKRVFPAGAEARVGLLPGDRVWAIDGIPLLPKAEPSKLGRFGANWRWGLHNHSGSGDRSSASARSHCMDQCLPLASSTFDV